MQFELNQIQNMEIQLRIEHITFTGADDSTDPQLLADFSSSNPRVEWGILISKSSMGFPRFPSLSWIDQFLDIADFHNLNISLHLCGSWLRRLLSGEIAVIDEIGLERWEAFQRCQLNFHAEDQTVNPARFFPILGVHSEKEFIFQVDGNMGGVLLNAYLESGRRNAAPLFDLSHGAGVCPDAWPEPSFATGGTTPISHGYAGGLGPDNLTDQLCRIADVASASPVWIDMETKLRNDRDQFDLSICEECTRQVSSFESMAAV